MLYGSDGGLESFMEELERRKLQAMESCIKAETAEEVSKAQAEYAFVESLEAQIHNVLARVKRELNEGRG